MSEEEEGENWGALILELCLSVKSHTYNIWSQGPTRNTYNFPPSLGSGQIVHLLLGGSEKDMMGQNIVLRERRKVKWALLF